MLRLTPLLFLFLPLLTSAKFTFSENSTLPSGSTCSRAYARSLPCNGDLLSLLDNTTDDSIRFSRALLESSCTTECYNALVQWTSDIRKDCANEIIEASGIQNNSVFMITEILDPKTQWLETLWFDTCLRDLTAPGHPFCKSYNDTIKALDLLYTPGLMSSLNNTAAFCNNSCAVQTSIYLHETSNIEPNVLDPRLICSNLDTQQFPFPESWKHKNSPEWQQGGESGRGLNGSLALSNSSGTSWQKGGEGGRPPVNESLGNLTGWNQGGEGGRGLNRSLVVNDTLLGLETANRAAGTKVSLLAVIVVLGTIVVGL